MTVPILAFFNNKGGVGKTSLVYHMAWMYADMGRTVVAVDLDPQANLTAAFLDEQRIDELWNYLGYAPRTMFDAMSPLMRGVGDIETPDRQEITPRLHLIAGNLALLRGRPVTRVAVVPRAQRASVSRHDRVLESRAARGRGSLGGDRLDRSRPESRRHQPCGAHFIRSRDRSCRA